MKKIFVPFVLICLSGCVLLGVPTGPEKEFQTATLSVKAKSFQDAVVAYNKVIADAPGTKLAAEALFGLALVHAHQDNPDKSYTRAIHAFEEFLKRYPENEHADEAQSWISLLKIVQDLKKQNESLNKSIEQLKRLDVRHEERRKH